LFSADTIKNNIKNTGVDGAVIARGAIGNPRIFNQLRDGCDFVAPTLEQQGQVISKHFRLACKLYGDEKALCIFENSQLPIANFTLCAEKPKKPLFQQNRPKNS
jgi:tRNA-dihydrouridine synthase